MQLGDLPAGYDHKYIFSHVGYNLKMTDLQAAVGVAQLEKLPRFVEARRRNWARLREALAPYEDAFVLPEPTPNSEPSWFGFALVVRPEAPFDRDAIVGWLEQNRIGTRQLFGGNLLRQLRYGYAVVPQTGQIRRHPRIAVKLRKDVYRKHQRAHIVEANERQSLQQAGYSAAGAYERRVRQLQNLGCHPHVLGDAPGNLRERRFFGTQLSHHLFIQCRKARKRPQTRHDRLHGLV